MASNSWKGVGERQQMEASQGEGFGGTSDKSTARMEYAMLTHGICCILTVFPFRVFDHVQVRGMAGYVGNES